MTKNSPKNLTFFLPTVFGFLFIICFLFLLTIFIPGVASAATTSGAAASCQGQEWTGSCSLAEPCDGIITGNGNFRSDGWYPANTQGFAFFSSRDAGIDNLAMAQGRLAFDVKGLNVRMIPLNSLYFGHIHRLPWNGCKDDFWYTLKLTGGEDAVSPQIWSQGFDFAAKMIDSPSGGFPSGWHRVELIWNNDGWTTTIDGIGTMSGVLNFELLSRDEEILIGVGSEIDGARNPVAEPGNEPGWGYGLFDMFGDGIEVAYRNLEWEFKNGNCSNPNAKDSEFCTENENDGYGECGCIGLSDQTIAPCSEEYTPVSGVSGGDPAGFLGFSLGWFWSLADLIGENQNQSNENSEAPIVTIEAAPSTVVPGQEISLVAMAENFRTRFGNMYFSWCLRDSNTGESNSYNSVIAGGELAEIATDISLPANAGPCCDWLTRTPATDTDGDGMDDEWEREKFVGRTFGDVFYENIEQVLPGDDPDQDGYYANRFKGVISNEYITLTPGLVDSLGNRYVPGASDARYTNIEEYILQTDPLNGDTDGDSYLDEEDFIGVGQQNLVYVPDKFVGQIGYTEVIASAVGVDQRKLAFIVQNSRKLYRSPLESFKIDLLSSSEYLPVGAASSETIDLRAEVDSADVKSSALVYEWELGGENICSETEHPELSEFCGPGKRELVLGGDGPLAFASLPGLSDLEIGDEYPIRVEVTDAASRQSASKEISLRRAATLDLTTNCDVSGANEGGESTVPMSGREPVTICVGNYGIPVSNENELTFQWYKDGEFDQAQSGIGKKAYQLLGAKLPGDYHTVELVASSGASQIEKMSGEIKIEVSGPSVALVAPDGIRASDKIADKESQFLPVSPGQDIEFVAEARGFGEQSSYEWAWSIGAESSNETSMSPDSSFYYQVPNDWREGDSASLRVQVRGEDEDGIPTEASTSITIAMSPENALAGQPQNFFSGLAAAFSWLDPQTKSVLQIVLIFALAIGVSFLGIYFYSIFFGANDDFEK